MRSRPWSLFFSVGASGRTPNSGGTLDIYLHLLVVGYRLQASFHYTATESKISLLVSFEGDWLICKETVACFYNFRMIIEK